MEVLSLSIWVTGVMVSVSGMELVRRPKLGAEEESALAVAIGSGGMVRDPVLDVVSTGDEEAVVLVGLDVSVGGLKVAVRWV